LVKDYILIYIIIFLVRKAFINGKEIRINTWKY
jgi:hypothetical protein